MPPRRISLHGSVHLVRDKEKSTPRKACMESKYVTEDGARARKSYLIESTTQYPSTMEGKLDMEGHGISNTDRYSLFVLSTDTH